MEQEFFREYSVSFIMDVLPTLWRNGHGGAVKEAVHMTDGRKNNLFGMIPSSVQFL
jgi:hypothetical protein